MRIKEIIITDYTEDNKIFGIVVLKGVFKNIKCSFTTNLDSMFGTSIKPPLEERRLEYKEETELKEDLVGYLRKWKQKRMQELLEYHRENCVHITWFGKEQIVYPGIQLCDFLKNGGGYGD